MANGKASLFSEEFREILGKVLCYAGKQPREGSNSSGNDSPQAKQCAQMSDKKPALLAGHRQRNEE
jgi:hypothetical protein